ncbi:ABC transporter permease [Hydrogenophaga sp.]|uniref:ABC transporter permease n=1 Tax=Hydrogenophaga sp. TaxID=1904254 RepID=UPI0027289C22|nr:ABC transporter permease [Hydrogenophaga sp.]MDO9436941.1 ABC transporter permease [Hydrogenophaga sp.]
MRRYLFRRLALALVTVLGVSLIVFLATRLSGDVVQLLVAEDASLQEIEKVRQSMGLSDPLWIQYLSFLQRAVVGDMGDSIRYRAPVMPLIFQRIPATAELALAAFAMGSVLGILAGILSASMRGSWLDRGLRGLAVLGQSMPHFWIGIMAILLFSVTLNWLPSGGRETWAHLLMPAATLAVFPAAGIMLMTRSALLENLTAEYVRFLRIKGASERQIIWKHAFRNSLIPVLAFAGIQIGNLLGGAVIVEAIFNWPGLGSLIVEAILGHDYPVVQGSVFLISILLISLNLAVDLLFGVVDPRVKFA